MVIVFVDPGWGGLAARCFGVVEPFERPPVGEGAVEAFDLAVGLGPVGPSAFVGDVQLSAGVGPQVALAAAAVEFLRDVKPL